MADAGRVIAGSAKGVRLAAPGPGTRPLSDRVKQTLFAVLEPELEDAAVLDLFAGSGAGGIEALSRGAARATFVEKDGGAARVIAENLRRTRLEAAAPGRRGATRSAGSPTLSGAAADGPFDLVLIDPPYADTAALVRAARAGRSPRAAGAASSWPSTSGATGRPTEVGLLASERERRFGETALTFYRRRSPDGPGAAPGDEEADEA